MTDQPSLLAKYWPPNREQVTTAVRWFVTTFGMGIAGYCVAWGFGSQEQIMQLLGNPYIQGAAVSAIMGLIPLIQSLFAKTERNIAKTAESMPNVQAVIMKPTAEGEKIAASITSPNVVAASDPKVLDALQPK